MEKNIIFFCFAAMMMLTIGRVSAETISDDTNDVLHAEWKTGLQEYSYKQATSDKPNVDITKIAYEISGQQLSLLMAVKGNIQDASNAVYSLFYNTTSATYQIYYTGGTGYCFGSALDGTEYTQGNATVQGNTLSTSMRLIGNGTTVKFWAGFRVHADCQCARSDGVYAQAKAPIDIKHKHFIVEVLSLLRRKNMKITLDEESIENIVAYIKNHPKEIREVIDILRREALAVIMERNVLEEGAKLYRAIQREINYTYNKG